MTRSRLLIVPLALLTLLVLASQAAARTGNAEASSGARALAAEARATAASDIPDNQVFLTFRDAAAGYSIVFPEGWLQKASGRVVTFRDKDNLLRVVTSSGGPFTAASVKTDLASLGSVTPSFRASAAAPLVLPSGAAFKLTYSTVSAPNPVTGKRVGLVVDRYYLSKAGKRAVVDLAAPKGADNVDAYRLIIKSFRWR